MDIQCRPMRVDDFGVIDCDHWASPQHVRVCIENQGIASMLAFEGERNVGQLYLQEYYPTFTNPEGWTGGWRPWADFLIAEPFGLEGRYLTLGCYHVGRMSDGSVDETLFGRGTGTALLESTVQWLHQQQEIDGLMSWAFVAGSKPLQAWGGQMPHTVYRRFGFREVKQIRDARLDEDLAHVDTSEAEADPALLRVMLRERK